MVLGLGIDVIEVARIGDVIRRHGRSFLKHVFTESEQAGAPVSDAGVAAYYAGRWSAKEAVAKALGTGIGSECGWCDIEIIRWPTGRPAVTLSGRAAATAAGMGIENIHITISHERTLACACAVAEGCKRGFGDGIAGDEHPCAEAS